VARWTFGIGDHSLAAQEWLLTAFQPSLTFYLTDQPHEFTASIDGTSEAGRKLQEVVQDVWAWRDGELPFRGPLIGASDSGDGSSHTVALTAHSYRERLAHWPIPLTGSTTGMTSLGAAATASGLGWRAINLTLPSSDLAATIVDAHTLSGGGAQITQSAQGGTPTDAAIDTLTATQPFDWDMVPTTAGKINYTTWSPTRGAAKPEVVAKYGGNTGSNVLSFTRTFDLSNFANQVWLSGQTTAGVSVVSKASTPYGPEGLWIIASDASNLDSAQLPAQATTLLQASETPQAAYTLTMAENWWQGPDHIWLGDQLQLVINTGRLKIAEMVRVQQIKISPKDGAENVQLTVGAQPIGAAGEYALVRTFRNISRRIKNLEWHT